LKVFQIPKETGNNGPTRFNREHGENIGNLHQQGEGKGRTPIRKTCLARGEARVSKKKKKKKKTKIKKSLQMLNNHYQIVKKLRQAL